MAFEGFPPEAIEFFEALEADNSKSFWDGHKNVYLVCVKGPMEALLADLAPEFGPPKVFRPNRDVRFSKDKSPYKTNIAAMVGELGYVSLSADGFGAGSGLYHMASDQLERYRRAVDDDVTGAEVEAIAETLRAKGREMIAHGALKTAPRGYPRDHPRIELLRSKGLTAWQLWEPEPWLETPEVVDRAAGVLRDAAPLNAWLAANVGDSQLEHAGR